MKHITQSFASLTTRRRPTKNGDISFSKLYERYNMAPLRVEVSIHRKYHFLESCSASKVQRYTYVTRSKWNKFISVSSYIYSLRRKYRGTKSLVDRHFDLFGNEGKSSSYTHMEHIGLGVTHDLRFDQI